MDKSQKIKLSSGIAVIAGIFSLLSGILLLLNYFQIATGNPLETESLKLLVDRFGDEPNNTALINDIRNLDLLARKAYFNNIWQIQFGSWILLISSVLLIVSLRVYHSLVTAIAIPVKSMNDNLIRSISHKWIFSTGIILLVFAFLASYKTIDHLTIYNSQIAFLDSNKTDIIDDEIEILQITEVSDTKTEVSDTSETETTEVKDTTKETTQKTISKPVHKIKEAEPKKETKTLPTYPTIADLKNNFNTFRGTLGNGIAYVKNIPTDWDSKSSKNIKWKVEIPKHGYNSPVIWQENLYIAGGDKESREVYCYNRFSGDLKWTRIVNDVPGSPAKTPKTTDDTGLSAPTVHCNGISVFAIFGNGDLVALTLNGDKIWAKNIGVPDNHYGHSSSLITWEEKLFIQYDSNKGGKIITLNVNTGDYIWQKKRKSRISWASPILAEINNKYQVIMSSTPIVAGYDIISGEELWSVDCMMGEVGPSPAYGNGFIYAVNEYAKLVAINPANNYQIEWESDEYLAEVASPVVKDSLLIIATSYGVVACYNSISGEKHWEYETDNGFYCSPIIADNKIYIVDMQGVTYIFELSSQLNLIGSPALNEATTTTPAFMDDGLYIRTDKHLYYISQN